MVVVLHMQAIIVDIRMPSFPVSELVGHQAAINGMRFSIVHASVHVGRLFRLHGQLFVPTINFRCVPVCLPL